MGSGQMVQLVEYLPSKYKDVSPAHLCSQKPDVVAYAWFISDAETGGGDGWMPLSSWAS